MRECRADREERRQRDVVQSRQHNIHTQGEDGDLDESKEVFFSFALCLYEPHSTNYGDNPNS